MKARYKAIHMKVAEDYAQLSYAKRRKVGCVIVINDIVIPGYNGTPPGWDNVCEDLNNKTRPEVIHAEQNALDKLIKTTMSSVGASVFVTTAPCLECAKRLLGANVKEVFYKDIYRNEDGLDFLRTAGIPVEHIDSIKNEPENF